MKSLRFIILIMYVLVSKILSAQPPIPDSIDVKAFQEGDSVTFQLTVYQIETQLAFLMQGVSITIVRPDTLVMFFPSATMVRHKVKRHPNEVKAVLESQRKRQVTEHDTINHVVRPDVLPLVSALNDTTAIIAYCGTTSTTRSFKIDVNRNKAIMVFSIRVLDLPVKSGEGALALSICSTPAGGDKREFEGRRLSGENAPHPNGLGEGLRKEDIRRRTFRRDMSVIIRKNDGE